MECPVCGSEVPISVANSTAQAQIAVLAENARLRAALKQAVDYADIAAAADGMPVGKKAKRLTATAVSDDGVGQTMVFDVSAARALLLP